ncbi:MAG: hypothetical protein OXC31_13255 [Spirochaetaceae bacterium]|nr:hypothetical protein [Spirochaetaceae bacterium]
MSVARTAADVLSGDVILELECVDRMYLKVTVRAAVSAVAGYRVRVVILRY